LGCLSLFRENLGELLSKVRMKGRERRGYIMIGKLVQIHMNIPVL
jgi:hypothetical protein